MPVPVPVAAGAGGFHEFFIIPEFNMTVIKVEVEFALMRKTHISLFIGVITPVAVFKISFSAERGLNTDSVASEQLKSVAFQKVDFSSGLVDIFCRTFPSVGINRHGTVASERAVSVLKMSRRNSRIGVRADSFPNKFFSIRAEQSRRIITV